MKRVRLLLPAAAWMLILSLAQAQTTTDALVDEGQKRLQKNQQSQQTIDQLHETTRNLADEYQNLLKIVDDLKVYNEILARQISNQETEKTSLEQSIANAAVIERQILPLLTRMLDNLDLFIQADLPFLKAEREQRVAALRRLIDNPNLSNAEKTRRVFEAFQIENDYGNTIEDYKGKLDIGNRTFDVDYLKVGRVLLAYRTVGGEEYGFWDARSGSWKTLTNANYKRNIDKGLRMARQEMAPELVTVPLVEVHQSKVSYGSAQ